MILGRVAQLGQMYEWQAALRKVERSEMQDRALKDIDAQIAFLEMMKRRRTRREWV